MDIPDRISNLSQGKVRVSLDEGKVWYNDTEFKDEAFCQRILRLMAEGQPVDYLVNFLNRLGKNLEFRSIMETFKFLCHEGLPITPDGCFLGYKGVRKDFYDKWSGKILNLPDGRRVEEDRELCNNDPNVSCGKGLHVGSYDYARGWASSDGVVVLVKVDPKDVISVPNHDCNKMRSCGYWVIKEFGKDSGILKGEVYDAKGIRVPGATYSDLEKRGQLDNDTNSHWSDEEGRTYGEPVAREDAVSTLEDEVCWYCKEPVEDCICEDEDYEEMYCVHCGEPEDHCICGDCPTCNAHINNCMCDEEDD
jgi:hypothetical protein